MDIEWLYNAIRSQLVVRIDFAGHDGSYRSAQVEVLGVFEDDDGIDPFYVVCKIGSSNMGQPASSTLRVATLHLPKRSAINAFLGRAVMNWCTEWQQEVPNLIRVEESRRVSQEVNLRSLRLPNLNFILLLSRLQGALDEFHATGQPAESSWALGRAQNRLGDVIASHTRDLTRPLERLTDGL